MSLFVCLQDEWPELFEPAAKAESLVYPDSRSSCFPPLPLQHEFARRVRTVDKLKTAHCASLAELDALFSTLQHRAFRGEL